MTIISLKHRLRNINQQQLIKKLIYYIRLAAYGCIAVSIIFLVTTFTLDRQMDFGSDYEFTFSDGIIICIVYIAFYLFFYITLPALGLLVGLYLFSKYSTKLETHSIKKELQLLGLNILIVLTGVA
jgi:hypothetical protein